MSSFFYFGNDNDDTGKMTGTIPTQLGRLTSMVNRLYLNGHLLSSSIPTQLGQLDRMSYHFNLYSNKLCSDVPTEVRRARSRGGGSTVRYFSNVVDPSHQTIIPINTSLCRLVYRTFLLKRESNLHPSARLLTIHAHSSANHSRFRPSRAASPRTGMSPRATRSGRCVGKYHNGKKRETLAGLTQTRHHHNQHYNHGIDGPNAASPGPIPSLPNLYSNSDDH